VCIDRAERQLHGLARTTGALLGVERGPQVTQQPIGRTGGLHIVGTGLPLGEALLRLGCGLLRGFACLVHETHCYS